jgi:hypothetical protein
VAPPQGGGNTVPYQGFKIYEQPAPPDDSAEAAPAASPPPAALKPAPVEAAPAPAAKPVAAAPATPAPPKPAPAATPPKSVAALIQQANSVPEPAKPTAKVPPPPAKSAAPAKPATPGVATGAPRALGTQMAAATPPAPAAASSAYVLQIGSYKSQADAAAAWKTYKAKHAALLAGYSENVQQADLGEKGTWYRLRIGGFSDREVANALCDRLKADGGACIPGR